MLTVETCDDIQKLKILGASRLYVAHTTRLQLIFGQISIGIVPVGVQISKIVHTLASLIRTTKVEKLADTTTRDLKPPDLFIMSEESLIFHFHTQWPLEIDHWRFTHLVVRWLQNTSSLRRFVLSVTMSTMSMSNPGEHTDREWKSGSTE